jgi:polyphenol oxidase
MPIKHNFGDKSFVLDYRTMPDNYIFMKQVHEANVLVVDSLEEAKEIQPHSVAVDATVTKAKGVVLCVLTADCATIVVEDTENEVVAAIHAGWKSAAKGVIENAISEMVKLGADVNNMKAYIGPCLSQESFECEDDMRQEFLKKDQSNDKFFEKKNDIKFLFDLKGFCEDALHKVGVADVDVSDIDTYTNDDWHSYRGFEANNPDVAYEYGKYRNLTTVEIE